MNESQKESVKQVGAFAKELIEKTQKLMEDKKILERQLENSQKEIVLQRFQSFGEIDL